MPRIPSYIKAEVFDINDQDVLLGEDIRGSGKTMIYTFDVLKEYFGTQQITGVTSINGFTGVVNINTGDVPAISNYNYVTDNQLNTLSRWVINGNDMELWDEDEKVMRFIGRDATHEIGLEMINPLRFDILVPNTVPTGKATFTLQPLMSDALSIISNDYRLMRFVTSLDAERVEAWKPVHLKDIIDGDNSMKALILDPITGEIKSIDGSLLGGESVTTADITANISAGAIDIGEVVLSGTNLQGFIQQLLVTTYDPTKIDNYVRLDGVSSVTLEVGSLYTTTLSTFYFPGTIFSADGSPDVDLTGPAITATYSGAGTNPSTGVVSTNIVEGSNFWSVIQTYDAGVGAYYDSDGVESHIFDALRVASAVNDNSSVITGKYKYWFSVGSIPTTSVGVRALINSGFWRPSTFDIPIPTGERQVAFYLPNTYSSVTVLYVESSNADVTSTFTIVPMSVDDAGGNPIGYDRFETTIPGIGYTSDATYRINIT